MKISKLLVLSIVVLCSTLLNSCIKVRQTSENSINKEMNGVAFDKIYVGSFFQVKFTQSDTYRVNVTIPEELEKHLTYQIEDGELLVHIDRHGLPIGFIKTSKTPELEISAPHFTEIKLRGASKFTMDGKWQVDDISFDIKGASKMECRNLQAERLYIKQQGASSFEANVHVQNLEIENSGACKMEIQSTGDQAGSNLSVKVAGASKIDLKELPFDNVTVEAAGASKIIVHPLKQFDVEVVGASQVKYVDTSKALQKNIDQAISSSVKAI